MKITYKTIVGFLSAFMFGLLLFFYSSTANAEEYNNTFIYRVGDTVYECNFGGYTGKVVAVLNYGNLSTIDVSKHYNEFLGTALKPFEFYYLKDANTVATISPTIMREYSVGSDNEVTLVNDYVASGETKTISISYYVGSSSSCPLFENSDIEILKVNLKDLKATFDENGVLSSYSTTTYNLNNNLLSYFKYGTFTDLGENYVFKVYSSVKNLVPYVGRNSMNTGFVSNASFALNDFKFDSETGVVSWGGFTYDKNAKAKGVICYVTQSGYNSYYHLYDKIFDTATEIDINLGSLYFYVSNMRQYPFQLYFIPYFVDEYGKLYVGASSSISVKDTVAYSDVADKVFTVGKRKENIGVAPSKGDLDAGLGDLYGSDLIISTDELEFSKLCSDFTFCEPYATYESGSTYLNDMYLTSFNADTEINAVWTGIKYPTLLNNYFSGSSQGVSLNYARVIIKCEYSAKKNPDLVAFSGYAPVYIDVNDKRLSIDVDKLAPTNDDYYLSRVYFTPFISTTVSTMGTSINPPTALYYGRSSVVKFDASDSANDEIITDYGNILDGSHSSSGTGYDDAIYEENKEFYDTIVGVGDAIVDNTVDIANGLNIDGFWNTLVGLGNTLVSFPSFVAEMFSFMPLWVTIALGAIIGVVIMLRFLGR